MDVQRVPTGAFFLAANRAEIPPQLQTAAVSLNGTSHHLFSKLYKHLNKALHQVNTGRPGKHPRPARLLTSPEKWTEGSLC